jgi:transposase
LTAARTTLPDLDALNPNELKALIVSQHELIVSRDSEIEQLKLLIAKLRRMQFGRSSEKLDRQIEQLKLRLEAPQQNDAEKVAALPAAIVNAEQAARPARRPLPAHLPREVRTYLPKQEACPDCGGELKHLGEDVSEMLEIEPLRFKVIRQTRPKLACACCDRIVQAEAPSRPIARGVAGPGLLAHVLVSKYGDHLPLYRQSEIYAREGVELDRSTLADWVCGTSQLFGPLAEALRRHVMAAQKLHADDTPVPVLAPGNGKTKTGRLWTYVRDDRPAGDQTPPPVWFAYTPDRKGEHPR